MFIHICIQPTTNITPLAFPDVEKLNARCIHTFHPGISQGRNVEGSKPVNFYYRKKNKEAPKIGTEGKVKLGRNSFPKLCNKELCFLSASVFSRNLLNLTLVILSIQAIGLFLRNS